METKNIGLRGIPVADTKICLVDGENGNLIYRGYNICDLVTDSTYEDTAYLLIYGDLPTAPQLEAFSSDLIKRREISEEILSYLGQRRRASPMDVLQGAISLLADKDGRLRDDSREANLNRAKEIVAKLPTIVASWHRLRMDLEPVSPSSDLRHAANFLYMMEGKIPDDPTVRDFDICLILHADHSFNASTFAARTVASTGAHMYAAVCAALGALSGELHGGANTKVMEALLEIGEVGGVEGYVKARLEAGGKVMGMGHAVYKTDDPRAVILKLISKRLAERTGARWFEMTRRLEEATRSEMRRRKGVEIYPNVDLYSASVYYMMGIPPDLFTPIFAISRAAGWAAHVMEEKFAEAQPKPALYRPEADYVGNYCGPQGCKYVHPSLRGRPP